MNILELIYKTNTRELDTAKSKLDGVDKATTNAEKSAQGLTKAFGELKNVGGPIGDVAGKVEGLGSTVANVGRAAVVLPGLLVAAAGAAGILAAVRFAGILDDLGDLARKLNTSSTMALLLKQEMEDAGLSAETFQSLIGKVVKALNKADEEGSLAAEAVKRLGVEVTKSTSPVELAQRLYNDYNKKIQDGSISAQQFADLQLILGRNVTEAMIAIEANAAAQERYNRFMSEGIGISESGEAATAAFTNANKDAAYVLSVMGSQLVSVVVPAFTALINAFVKSYENGGLVKGAFEALVFVSNALMVPVRVLTNLFVALDLVIQSVGKSLGALFAAIETRSLNPFKELKNDIAKAFKDADAIVKANPLWGTDSGTVKGAGPALGSAGGGVVTKPSKTKSTSKSVGRTEGVIDLGSFEDLAAVDKLAAQDRRKAAEEAERTLQRNKAIAQSYADMIDPAAKYVRQITEVRKLQEMGLLTIDQAIEAEFRLQEAIQGTIDKSKEQTETVNVAAEATAYVAGQIANTIGEAFVSGEFNFKSFLGTMLKGLAQLILQLTIIEPLMKAVKTSFGAGGGGFGSLFGNIASAFGGSFAEGGNPPVGKVSLVGENGPELLVPRGPMTVIPNHKLNGSNGSVINISQNVVINGGIDSEQRKQEVMREMAQQTRAIAKQTIAEERRRGGMLQNA